MLAPIHSAEHAPDDYSRTDVYYSTGLVTPHVKTRPSGYSRQYGS